MQKKQLILENTKVDRNVFLRRALFGYFSPEEIEVCIQSPSLIDHVDEKIIDQIAKEIIKQRCILIGSVSAFTSVGGALQTMVLAPVDFAQVAYHTIKLSQELYFLYGGELEKNVDCDTLLAMMCGGVGAISLTSASLSAIGQVLYKKAMGKLMFQSMKVLPVVGCVIHSSIVVYSMYILSQEYIKALKQLTKEQQEKYDEKFLECVLDAEYNEVIKESQNFCDLAKLKDLYTFFEEGYLDEEQFHELKKLLV